MDTAFLIGITGMLFIVAGWVIALREIPPFKLSLLYCAGSCLLALYAAILEDLVFFVLNSAAAVFSALNMIRALKIRTESQQK